MPPQPDVVPVKATRGLAITQIIVGLLTVVSGILSIAWVNYWASYVGFAIWGGIWVSPVCFLLFLLTYNSIAVAK